MSEFESYIPEGEYNPFAKPSHDLYGDACEDLLLPTPSVKFQTFTKINTMTGGLRPNEFTILCGATGTGKTTLCANLSRDLICQKIPHFVASVETGHTDFMKRVISAMVERDWNTGDPIPLDDLKQFHVQHGTHFQTETLQLSLYDNRISVKTLMADIAWMVKHKGIKVALIDNLNFFLDVRHAADQILEMDRVIHDLIMFCKRTPVHVIMVMHPRKAERIESENDIKGSSTANQEAHNILLFNRPHPDLIKAGTAIAEDRELMIAKMRRKGKYVRRRLILKAINGVTYYEGGVL
jgi:replicative DNA helicase